MEKTWYIKINGKQQGPYTLQQLKWNHQVTPDTLVWDPKTSSWVPLRKIPELQEIFKDPEDNGEEKDEDKTKSKKLSSTLVLEMPAEPPQFIWLLLAAAMLLLILFQLFKDK
jgi:hypothetical protein